jgi:hypothetical protein
MKKLLSLALMICMLLSLLTLPVSAESDELLLNGGFEEGDESNFVRYGSTCTVEVAEDYAHDGDYGMLITDRTHQYDTYAYPTRSILKEGGPGKYKAGVWVKLSPSSEYGGNAQLVLNFKLEGSDKTTYLTSPITKLTGEWQYFTFEKKASFTNEDTIESSFLYVQSFDENLDPPEIMVDSFTLKKTTPINGVKEEKLPDITLEHINVFGKTRAEKTTFGAIRWDAWYTHDGVEQSVISQVERSLSPKKFHFRAPFFAEITKDNKIIIPEYDQAIFDKEMEYAIEAGVDYFAYVWYSSDMKASRIFHTQSKYKNDVKMCACFDGNAINKPYARRDMEQLFVEDYYMTVLDGRPLMYYFGSNDNLDAIKDDIKYYRQLTKKLGIPEPYAVIMNVSPQQAHNAYGDAVSSYGVSGVKNNGPFRDLMAKAHESWLNYQKTGIQYVPTVTYGWHPEPRYINPVSWMTVAEGNWADYASPAEITEHLTYAYSYMQHPLVKNFTVANTFIAYAWNEHDEGGWICPTLAVDENGNQLYNSDGTKMINDERVKATRAAVDNYKNNNLASVTVGGIENGTQDSEINKTPAPSATADTTTPTPIPEDKKNGNTLPYVIIIGAGAVILAGAAVAVIVIIRKKGKENG